MFFHLGLWLCLDAFAQLQTASYTRHSCCWWLKLGASPSDVRFCKLHCSCVWLCVSSPGFASTRFAPKNLRWYPKAANLTASSPGSPHLFGPGYTSRKRSGSRPTPGSSCTRRSAQSGLWLLYSCPDKFRNLLTVSISPTKIWHFDHPQILITLKMRPRFRLRMLTQAIHQSCTCRSQLRYLGLRRLDQLRRYVIIIYVYLHYSNVHYQMYYVFILYDMYIIYCHVFCHMCCLVLSFVVRHVFIYYHLLSYIIM